MRFWPFSKKNKPKEELFAGESKVRKGADIESLKAGRLASLALDSVRAILEKTGPRPAGSDESREAARMLLDKFKDNSDDTVITSFRSCESSYFGVFKLIALSVPVILFFLWFSLPIISLPVYIFVCYIAYHEFFLCLPLKKHLGRHCDMSNVQASIEPEGEVHNTVIFTAHHDCAPMFTIPKEHQNGIIVSLYVPLLHYFLLGLLSIVMFIADLVTGGILKVSLPSLVALIFLIIATASSAVYLKLYKLVGTEYAPGAGDNLISSCILTELAHYFYWKKKNGEGLKDTRLVFVSFDGEECGLKGSEHWYKQNAEQLHNAVAFNIDCPYYSEQLSFLSKDVNGFVSLSKSFASACADDAKSMGYKVKVGELSLFTGATDAASAARAGIDATTLMGIPLSGSASAPYHTPDDVPDVLDKATIEEVISIAIKIVEKNYSSQSPAPVSLPALSDESRKFTLTR